MTKRPKDKPATVPFRATQAGEARPRWWWVEPSVWTERMLTALEHGVKDRLWAVKRKDEEVFRLVIL